MVRLLDIVEITVVTVNRFEYKAFQNALLSICYLFHVHHFKPFLSKEFQGDELFELTLNYSEFIQNSYSENVNYPFYLIKLLFVHSQVTDLAIDSVLILSTSATHLFTFNI